MSGSEGSNIPEVVKKQAERADQIHRQAYPDQYPQEKKEEKPEEGNTPPEGAAPKPEETPKAEEKPKEEIKEAKPPEKPPEPGKVEEDWKHKYDVLLGKYNAEVPKLHTQVAAMQNMTRELQSQVGELKAAAKEKAAAQGDPAQGRASEEDRALSPGDRGRQDLQGGIPGYLRGRGQDDRIGPRRKERRKSPEGRGEAQRRGKTQGQRRLLPPPPPATDPRATFDYYLNRDVPDWPQVNKDPEFITFLQAPDPNYPGTKLQSIQAAYDACDFTTVIGHFRDFKESRKAAAPAGATPPPNPASQPNQPTPKPEGEKPPEEKYLAPPKGGRGGTPSGVPLVTPGDLAKFYDGARRGLWGPIDGEKFRKEEARLLSALTGTKT